MEHIWIWHICEKKQLNQREFQSCRVPEQRNPEWKEKVSMDPHNILFSCMLDLVKTSSWEENINVPLEIRQCGLFLSEKEKHATQSDCFMYGI